MPFLVRESNRIQAKKDARSIKQFPLIGAVNFSLCNINNLHLNLVGMKSQTFLVTSVTMNCLMRKLVYYYILKLKVSTQHKMQDYNMNEFNVVDKENSQNQFMPHVTHIK